MTINRTPNSSPPPQVDSGYHSADGEKSLCSQKSESDRSDSLSVSSHFAYNNLEFEVLLANRQTPADSYNERCPDCKTSFDTRIRYHSGTFACLSAFVLLPTGFFFWVPFYAKYFKDVWHHCQSCGKVLAKYKRL